jgi:hypothetical protein
MEVSCQLHTSPLYPQGKSPQYPLHRRLGGSQGRFGCYGEHKNLLHLLGIELQSSSPKSYTKLKLCFLKVFTITIPTQQKFVNSCDIDTDLSSRLFNIMLARSEWCHPCYTCSTFGWCMIVRLWCRCGKLAVSVLHESQGSGCRIKR